MKAMFLRRSQGASEYFCAMNVMSSMYGLGVDLHCKTTIWFNRIMYAVHMTLGSVAFIDGAQVVIKNFYYGVALWMCLLLFNFISLISIKRNQSLISRTLDLGDRCLSDGQKRRLINLSHILIVTILIDFIFRVAIEACMHAIGLVAYEVAINVTTASVYNVSFEIYIYLCAMYGEIMMAHIYTLSRFNLSLDQLESNLHQIKSLVCHFDAKLSFIPLIWFAYSFAVSLTDVLEYEKEADKTSNSTIWKVSVMYEIVVQLSGVLAVVMVIDNINTRLHKEYQVQYEKILKQAKLSDRADYVRSRKDDYQLRFTACEAFELNKTCILSYSSHIVTFTVLFLQLNKAL
ncbi:hypothetical protein HDE_06754 [Halotydeus destructor]|nr:hypothetical protein HDE_06754 [Halotydeus destructor]